MTNEERILGGLYGSLVGDALGVPVEFRSREDRRSDPVGGMRRGGTHGQPAGTWSDDGALLLCSVESLAKKGFETQDMGERFARWYTHGLWTAHGTLFDIGHTTRKALKLIEQGCPTELAGGNDISSNGNGSLMRILPVALGCQQRDASLLRDQIERASSITHAHLRSKMACVFHGLFVWSVLEGSSPQMALIQTRHSFSQLYPRTEESDTFHELLNADFASIPEAKIQSGGYVMETLTASIWCLLTASSFSECVLKAVNLGEDTDTTGCVAGGLAGVHYGINAIPQDWISTLPRADDLRQLFKSFIATLPSQ